MSAELRDYQRRAVDLLYDWASNNDGNPCLVMPTGSGKSHVIAALCKEALQAEPKTRVLMLTHVKELIEQNAAKLRQHWPNAPLGIYSAGLRRRDIEPITFGGVQSLRKRADEIGHVDLVIVDEAHLISHAEVGSYRKLIADLKAINPDLRVVGLTATPYRLGHGMITDKPAIFDALIEPVSVLRLIKDGYLAPLRSKVTTRKVDADGVHRRGGEYIASELAAAVDDDRKTRAAVLETIDRADGRKAWLFFCAGVAHAVHVRDELRAQGVVAETVTGDTPSAERRRILDDYKSGKITALTNANVLTTGFDYPNIDLIAMMRPTLSPGLYVQMAGRGLRVKSVAADCLVLDFAGNVRRHGPITDIVPPAKRGAKQVKAKTKTCDQCREIMPAYLRRCPACGCEPPLTTSEHAPLKLHDDDILQNRAQTIKIRSWAWAKHTSRRTSRDMLKASYYPVDLSAQPVTEYLTIMHDGYAGRRSLRTLLQIATYSGTLEALKAQQDQDLDLTAEIMQRGAAPTQITVKRDAKFYRVLDRDWEKIQQ